MATGKDKQPSRAVQGSEGVAFPNAISVKDVDNDNHVDQHNDDVDEVDHGLGCRGC